MEMLSADSHIIVLMYSMGLLGAILFKLDLYRKLEDAAGLGAILHLGGLICAMAGAIVIARNSGVIMNQAIISGLKVTVMVAGPRVAISNIVALLTFILS